MIAARSDEWPTKLFKIRGFAKVEVGPSLSRGCMVVTLSRNADGSDPMTVNLPEGYRTMTIEALRHWVDAEVEKLSGPTDFPAISFNNAVPANG